MSNRKDKLALYNKDPHCHWCKRETKLTNLPNIKGKADPLMATVDHVISRFNPYRWVVRKPNERRKVLACYECNMRRATEENNALSKEELIRRSNGFSLSPKGKPIIESPVHSFSEVLMKFKEKGIETTELTKYESSLDNSLSNVIVDPT